MSDQPLPNTVTAEGAGASVGTVTLDNAALASAIALAMEARFTAASPLHVTDPFETNTESAAISDGTNVGLQVWAVEADGSSVPLFWYDQDKTRTAGLAPAGWTITGGSGAVTSAPTLQEVNPDGLELTGVQAGFTPTVPAGQILGGMTVGVVAGTITLTFADSANPPLTLSATEGWIGESFPGVPLDPPTISTTDPAAQVRVGYSLQIPA